MDDKSREHVHALLARCAEMIMKKNHPNVGEHLKGTSDLP